MRYLLVVLILLTACAPAVDFPATLTAIPTVAPLPSATPAPTWTTQPTYTPYPTYTKAPTYTPLPTLAPVLVTATFTPTPEIDPLFAPHGPGFYLVGVDIAPSIWRSTGSGDGCYWKLTDKAGKTIKNHFGLAGGTAIVTDRVFEVQFDDKCGIWEYLGPT